MINRPRRHWAGHAFLSVALLSMAATAGSVYLNGQNIDTIRNQRLKNVNVHIDGQGNVHIEAPGYQVLEEGPEKPAAEPTGPNPSLSKRYFLVTEQTRPGAVQYDLEIFVNGRLVRRIEEDEPQLITEISASLQPGSNTIRIKATKNIEKGRRSYSEQDVLRVIIGQGQTAGQQVTIQATLAVFSMTAADMMPIEKSFSINAK